jgi:hypothetical protein
VEELKRAEANAAELSQRLGDTEGQRQAVVEELKRAEANAAELSQRLNDSEAQRQALEQKCESAIDRAKAAEVKLQNLEAELGTLRPPKIWQTIREWRMASTRNNQRLEDLALEPPNKPSDPIFARDPRYGLGFFMFAVLAVVFFLVSLGSQTGGAIWFIVGGICGYVAYRFYVKWKLTR